MPKQILTKIIEPWKKNKSQIRSKTLTWTTFPKAGSNQLTRITVISISCLTKASCTLGTYVTSRLRINLTSAMTPENCFHVTVFEYNDLELKINTEFTFRRQQFTLIMVRIGMNKLYSSTYNIFAHWRVFDECTELQARKISLDWQVLNADTLLHYEVFASDGYYTNSFITYWLFKYESHYVILIVSHSKSEKSTPSGTTFSRFHNFNAHNSN